MHGGVRRIEAAAWIPALHHLVCDTVERADEFSRCHPRPGADLWFCRMRLRAMHGRFERHDTFMSVNDRELRRLTDNNGFGPRQIPAEASDHVDDAKARDLLVVGEHDMDGCDEVGCLKFRDE